MFKTNGFILNIQKIRDSYFRIILVTREYGRISCWHKIKSCGYDIGDVIHISIERIGNNNTIKSVDTVLSVSGQNWNYHSIISFLDLISLLEKTLPESMLHVSIFDDYITLIKILHSETTVPDRYHFLLLKIRILKTLGILNPREMHNEPIGRYIINNIRNTPIQLLLKSRKLDETTLNGIIRTIDLSTDNTIL
ncbi:hypothetical protein KBD33_00955 [Candidatus Gracilibacteria bacterium]|nr:hypothetical protein [Candidatus Gracilibacteria bacterium]